MPEHPEPAWLRWAPLALAVLLVALVGYVWWGDSAMLDELATAAVIGAASAVSVLAFVGGVALIFHGFVRAGAACDLVLGGDARRWPAFIGWLVLAVLGAGIAAAVPTFWLDRYIASGWG